MSNHVSVAGDLASVEAELRRALATPHPALVPFYGMMHYHLGWVDAQLQPTNALTGKRLRPLLCLLACRAAGGDPAQALPAAAAIEILHNFSLIHDDIEDNDATRRHRPTVWSIWGQPQAINVGDGMFALAHLALSRLSSLGVSPSLISMAISAFQETCLTLTEGQYLDMSFEERFDIDMDDYLWMIHAKTAELLSSSTRIGSLLAGGDVKTVTAYREFGASLGMAFQIQDDVLGVWGQEAVTGKPAGSDILRKKKTLPLVYAIETLKESGREAKLARLRNIYSAAAVSGQAHADVLEILELVRARRHCEDRALHYQQLAMDSLKTAGRAKTTDRAGIETLRELSVSLLNRQN